jgi:hypothetical protein
MAAQQELWRLTGRRASDIFQQGPGGEPAQRIKREVEEIRRHIRRICSMP